MGRGDGPTRIAAVTLLAGVALVAASSCAQAGVGQGSDSDDSASDSSAQSGAATLGTGGIGAGGKADDPDQTSSASTVGSGGANGSGGSAPCTESPCKLTSPQCGCATGEMCNTFLGNRSCTTEGTQAQGEECNTNSLSCLAGLRCIVLDNSAGRCQSFCDTDAECQLPGGRCVFDLSDTQGTKACSENCDPVTSQGCTFAGQRCTAGFDETDTGFTLCMTAGAGTQGSACSAESDCAAGYSCVTVNNQQACRQWCTVGSTCLTQCIQAAEFTPPLVIGTVSYGVCAS